MKMEGLWRLYSVTLSVTSLNLVRSFLQSSALFVSTSFHLSMNAPLFLQKEKRALEVKRLDLDACKNKVKKSQTPEKMRQVINFYTSLCRSINIMVRLIELVLFLEKLNHILEGIRTVYFKWLRLTKRKSIELPSKRN